ncbi:hypothetical protein Syun_009527 [Stephania yunnanensis]|uniref:WRKY domain-containing protein n=1 Tax=Stephania yunnanensis TaxID=152371 RepID=A0AAP0KGB1_9MAGN
MVLTSVGCQLQFSSLLAKELLYVYFFSHKTMDKDQGDLADIVRSGAGGALSTADNHNSYWQFPLEPEDFRSAVISEPLENFGDPFSAIQNPLLHELNLASPGYFNSSNSCLKTNVEDDTSSISTASLLSQTILEEEMGRPCNIFSRMLQISPNLKIGILPREISTTSSSLRPLKVTSHVDDMINTTNSSIDSGAAVQISSPRNHSIKRRKSQAKKVVCIPAPAAANSRPSGEVVPSDLWAWRKYGQKPIKGSPYPRGYYRCSSSKGCSARKQVERSRTDPNMLVITYTSEHNHPWPTQRNALAGSTRTQPLKSNNNAAASKNTSSPTSSQTPKFTNMKEEPNENTTTCTIGNNNNNTNSNDNELITSASVKEEIGDITYQKTQEIICEREFDQNQQSFNHQIYKPVLAMESSNHHHHQTDDLMFADLGELDPSDPLHLLFTQGFSGAKSEDQRDHTQNKGLGPFSLFDWSPNNPSSFGEASGRGL